jgi:hypothetical protein
MAREDTEDEKICLKLQEMCLENPWQPRWNQGRYGKRKPCGDCYAQCVKQKASWPFHMCPSEGN